MWAIGSGSLFAFALLHKYQYLEFDVKTAAIVTYRVLKDAIEVGSYGLGYPIDIWKIDENGVSQFLKEDYKEILDKSSDLINQEIELLKKVSSSDIN